MANRYHHLVRVPGAMVFMTLDGWAVQWPSGLISSMRFEPLKTADERLNYAINPIYAPQYARDGG